MRQWNHNAIYAFEVHWTYPVTVQDLNSLLLLLSQVLFPLSCGDLVFMYYLQATNDNDVRNIVLSYLVHNCFNETVDSFIACTGMKQPVDNLEGMEKRKSK